MIWLISLFSALIASLGIYYSLQFRNIQFKTASVIAFTLLLMNETLDLMNLSEQKTIIMVFAEMLEMFITVGFFSLLYYIKLQNYEGKKKIKKRSRK